MRYLNIDLTIDAGAGPDYATTVQAPSGRASAIFRFPFSQTELQTHLQTLQIALLRSSGEYRTTLSPEERAVQRFGQILYESLLTGEVGKLYAQTQQMATNQDELGVRLRLAIAPAHLAAIPWEFLCDPSDGSYPCLLPDTSLVRSLYLTRPVSPLKVSLPLRVLGMIASPSDQQELEIEKEQDRLRRAFGPLQANRQMELQWVNGQSWEALQEALLYHGPWHIFHFIGHGGVHPQSGDGVLAFANERGAAQLLSADEVATLLAGRRLRLVVLNACDGARSNDHDVFSSTAATLARRGIPGVLAMQYAISDAAAVQLTDKFYSALARGIPLDEAVVAARQAIKLSRRNTLEWGTPVLYLCAQDGILFDFEAELGGQALQPSRAGEPMQRSPVKRDPMVRPENPPASSIGPTPAGMGLAAPLISLPKARQTPPALFPGESPLLLVSVPPPSAEEKGQIWTPGFTRLFVVASAGTLLLAIISIAGANNSGGDARQSDQMDLILQIGLAAVALGGLFFTNSWLIRTGLIAQMVAMVIEGIVSILILQPEVPPDPNSALALIYVYFPAAASFFLLVSLIVFSYTAAGWRMLQDIGLNVLQVILTYLVLAYVSGITLIPQYLTSFGYAYYAPLPCAFLAFFILVTRPWGWKKYPFLIIGAFFYALHIASGYIFIQELFDESAFLSHSFPFSTIGTVQFGFTFFNAFYGLSYVLTILGMLLLLQTERVRKRVQFAQPTSALVK